MRPLSVSFVLLALPAIARAQAVGADQKPDSSVTLGTVTVTAATPNEDHIAVLQRLTLPATVGISAPRIRESINILDAPDAVKYLPSLFIRKRNYGDTQATLGTRVWGVSSSARSLIFADDVPITALIANNNTLGGPRWGMISPEEIARIDVMYGPFSAAYSGSSMGAVMAITTRQPDRLTATVEQSMAQQSFSLYGTDRMLPTRQTTATVGDRFGKISFWISGNYQNSNSQPLLYVTAGTPPTGTLGWFPDTNKLGAMANVLGATGMLHTEMSNAKAKIAYDLTPSIRATYTAGLWINDAASGTETYLRKAGTPTFGGQAGFATGNYDLFQRHYSNSISVRSDTKKDWDFEVIGAAYAMQKDQQRFPTAVASDSTFGTAGRIALLDGTGWVTGDLKGTWHRDGLRARHTVSFGVHGEHYRLFNPTYNTSDWQSGSLGTVASEGDGKTETFALWAQDAWKTSKFTKLTLGGRVEKWRGFDGYNANSGTTIHQPAVSATRFSPKLSFDWLPGVYQVTASVAKAYRFATPAELYQLVTTGATFTSPDPNLEPDDDLAAELRLQRFFSQGTVQLSLFQDDVHDAIISQFKPLVPNSSTLFNYLSNVDHVRARGAEVALGGNDLLMHGLDLSANATYVSARTLALSGRANANASGPGAVGKFLPNIPEWRAGFSATYRPTLPLALTLGGRYSSRMYTTLDNADVRFNTYQAFGSWFVLDGRANYTMNDHWSGSLGVDNMLNRKYFLFHPFPQRTLVASARFHR